VWLRSTFHATPLPLYPETLLVSLQVKSKSVDISLDLGERVAAGRVRVKPLELLLKMFKVQSSPHERYGRFEKTPWE